MKSVTLPTFDLLPGRLTVNYWVLSPDAVDVTFDGLVHLNIYPETDFGPDAEHVEVVTAVDAAVAQRLACEGYQADGPITAGTLAQHWTRNYVQTRTPTPARGARPPGRFSEANSDLSLSLIDTFGAEFASLAWGQVGGATMTYEALVAVSTSLLNLFIEGMAAIVAKHDAEQDDEAGS